MIKRPRISATVKMGRSDSFGRIAPVINHQQRQVAAMASGAERPQMFFSVGRIVVASGSKARGQVCLDSSQARSHLFREYETRAPRAAAQKAWV